jgi:tight adherence protein C
MIPVLAAALAAVGGTCAVAAMAAAGSRGFPAVEVLPGTPGHGLLARSVRAAGGSRFGCLAGREEIDALGSGSGDDVPAAEVAGRALLTAGAIGALALASPAPVLGLPAIALALRWPRLVRERQRRTRHRAAAAEVPVFLDLLAVATSTGLAPQLAVPLAASAVTGPLAGELAIAVERSHLGGRWRDELESLGARVPVPELQRAITLLRRSDALGSSLAEETARLATDARAARRARASERARAAPVKMLFPLVFLILPAFLLLTVVPVLLATVRSIV